MGKIIEITPELEKDIVYFCDDELNYHINESGCVDEYETEIKAQIELLRLLGYDDKANKYENEYKGGNNMLEFKTMEELQDCEELQNMGRYEWKKVILKGKEVIACTTDQQYEDIIWGGTQEMLEELSKYYEKDFYTGDLATEVRDFILARLEDDYDTRFVDVYDEY